MQQFVVSSFQEQNFPNYKKHQTSESIDNLPILKFCPQRIIIINKIIPQQSHFLPLTYNYRPWNFYVHTNARSTLRSKRP